MQKLEIETTILEALKKSKIQKLSFTQLLNECRKKQPTLSKVTLTKYLKILLQKGEIEKRFNAEHFKGYYQITSQSIMKLMIESWIERLGEVAIRCVMKKKFNKPIDVDSNICDEIDRYLEVEPKKDSLWSWKSLFEYVEKEYPPQQI